MSSKKQTTPRDKEKAPDIKKINELMDEAEMLLKKSKRQLKAAKKLLEPYLPKKE